MRNILDKVMTKRFERYRREKGADINVLSVLGFMSGVLNRAGFEELVESCASFIKEQIKQEREEARRVKEREAAVVVLSICR